MKIRKTSMLFIGLWLLLAAAVQAPVVAEPQDPQERNAAPGLAEIGRRAEQFLRTLYAWGPAYQVTAEEVKPSPVPELYEVAVQVSFQGESEAAVVYVSRDGRYMFRGEMNDMNADPFAAIRQQLTLDGYPSKGPPDAPIVIVEFGDFQCPSCRQLDRLLRQLLATNRQIRLVFKDFPLEQIHPWAMTAALAGRCAFAHSAEAFWKLHDLIYDNQDTIPVATAADKLIQLAEQAGVSSTSMRSCMADPKTTELVRQSIAEGRRLDVNSTPTSFVNGRRVVGPNQPLIEQYVTWLTNENGKTP
jgi:protein-disulfide isomerase